MTGATYFQSHSGSIVIAYANTNRDKIGMLMDATFQSHIGSIVICDDSAHFYKIFQSHSGSIVIRELIGTDMVVFNPIVVQL